MSAAPNSRRVVCEFVIAAAVCGASYYFLVDGALAKIAAVRADIAKVQQNEAGQSGVGGLSDTQVSDLVRTTAERVASLRTQSLPATDESTMFAKMSELASAHSVRIEQLNPVQAQGGGTRVVLPPGVQSGTPAAAEAAAPADGPPPVKDIRVGYSLAVTGKYTDIAGFIGTLTNRLGYTTVKSVRISQPDVRTPDALRAAIETEHIALDLSAIKMPSTPAKNAEQQAAHE